MLFPTFPKELSEPPSCALIYEASVKQYPPKHVRIENAGENIGTPANLGVKPSYSPIRSGDRFPQTRFTSRRRSVSIGKVLPFAVDGERTNNKQSDRALMETGLLYCTRWVFMDGVMELSVRLLRPDGKRKGDFI